MATKNPAPKKYALDIFAVLAELSKGNTKLWDTFSDEEKKGFSPLIIMQWMTGTSDMRQIILLNEFVNPFVFNIGAKHTELMAKLLAVASSKQPHRYYWMSQKKKTDKISTLGLNVLKQRYEYSTREAREAIGHLKSEDIIELAEELGWQKDEIKKLTKELG